MQIGSDNPGGSPACPLATPDGRAGDLVGGRRARVDVNLVGLAPSTRTTEVTGGLTVTPGSLCEAYDGIEVRNEPLGTPLPEPVTLS